MDGWAPIQNIADNFEEAPSHSLNKCWLITNKANEMMHKKKSVGHLKILLKSYMFLLLYSIQFPPQNNKQYAIASKN